jgi:pimeloyl-ACP methyl ester carboxylesterase
MLKATTLITLTATATATAAAAAPATIHAQGEKNAMQAAVLEPSRSGHVPVNGLDYYYEIYGQGEPLLLLHGGLGSIGMFGPLLPMLAANRQVIAVDLHGHGRTALGDREISLPDIGNDLAVLLQELGYEQVDVLGYSFGGGAAFRLAVQHPALVRRLAMVSAGYAQNGFYPDMIAMQVQLSGEMAEMMKDTPMYQSYVAVAPRPDDFPRLLDAMGDLMRRPYDWSEDVKTLRMPVMIVFGDSDMYRPEHIIDFYRLLGGGQGDAGWMRENMPQNRLAILPDLTHYETFMAPAMVTTVLPFLNGESGIGSWAEQVNR